MHRLKDLLDDLHTSIDPFRVERHGHRIDLGFLGLGNDNEAKFDRRIELRRNRLASRCVEDQLLGLFLTEVMRLQDLVLLTVGSDPPEVKLLAVDKYGQETDDVTDAVAFLVDRGEDFGEGNLSEALTITYEILNDPNNPGDATDPQLGGQADYSPSLITQSTAGNRHFGEVTIPAGQSSAFITVTPIDDDEVEWDERIAIKLHGVVGNEEAEVTIFDNDEIGGFINRNIDTESTGETKEAINNGVVAVDVQGGQVTLDLPMKASLLIPCVVKSSPGRLSRRAA